MTDRQFRLLASVAIYGCSQCPECCEGKRAVENIPLCFGRKAFTPTNPWLNLVEDAATIMEKYLSPPARRRKRARQSTALAAALPTARKERGEARHSGSQSQARLGPAIASQRMGAYPQYRILYFCPVRRSYNTSYFVLGRTRSDSVTVTQPSNS